MVRAKYRCAVSLVNMPGVNVRRYERVRSVKVVLSVN